MGTGELESRDSGFQICVGADQQSHVGAKHFIEGGSDVDAQDEDGWIALMHIAAAVDGDIEQLGLLIKAGADVNVQDNDGGTALMRAAHSGDADRVRLLI